ncbi:hypothetical protein [Endozoicomonas arenosclerae]|uniref:hypothetical protein n=1 Tax=Endozoicomonas arenosclerae TaxID=1633495 RepID=UPI000780A503|nr:hypothetical protein [Endozoicomonas arenosclerae]
MKLNKNEVKSVTLSSSTMREDTLIINYKDDPQLRKSKFYDKGDLEGKTPYKVYFELKETYENTGIEFRTSFVD